ncbi:hypothetical protein Tco_1044079 [Tanacetum coccineum]|uniref:Uncharacterized protein n=1 Tax=Tanacetum coccineum TaxID=301880 RepID=A0ABQ5GPY2_9ASTR
MTLVLIAKAFKLNYSTPTNNNQRISSNPCNKKIAQSGMNMGQDRHMQMVGGNGGNQFRLYVGQNVGNLNGYNAVQNVENQNTNQNVNGTVVAAWAEGNGNGNGNNVNQLLIAQKEEVGIQLQAEKFDLMAAAGDLDEIEEVNANCILMANLQQASTSGTQTDKAPVYDSDGSAKINALHLSSAKTITTLNEEITNLSNQLSKEKSIVSFLQEEKKKLKFDFKICKDELLDKQIQLENKIKELDNILLEVVEKLLEEEMLVGSSNHWVKVMLMRLVILVCSQLKRMRVIVSSFVKSMKSCFGGMMMIFGFFDGLEMEAFGEATEVDNDWAIAGEMLEFLDTFGIVGFSERYNRVNIVEDERLEWSKDFNKAMLIDVVEASVKVEESLFHP